MKKRDYIIKSSPYTGIEQEDESHFLNELLKWLYEDKNASNNSNHDLLRVYDNLKDNVSDNPFPFTNFSKEYKFPPTSKEDLETLFKYGFHDKSLLKPPRESSHRVFLYSFVELIKQNIIELCNLVANYHQIPQILNSSGHKGEILIIQKIVKDLQNLKKSNNQLIPDLYCDRNFLTRLSSKREFLGGLLISGIIQYRKNVVYGYFFSKSSSSVFENKLIAILNARLELLSGIYKTPKVGKKDEKDNQNLQTIEDIIMSDNLEIFFKFEKSFIEIGSIEKKKDDSLWWIEKPTRLIAFIIILYDHGYINRRIFESSRTQCRSIFEKRYNINLGQLFERARVEKKKKEIANYKTFPVYKDIILLY